MGKSVLYSESKQHAETSSEKRRRVTAKAKTTTAAAPPAAPTAASPRAKNKQSLAVCQEPEVFSATAQDNSREPLIFDDLLCCVTSVLEDIPEEHLSTAALQDAFSRGLLFCL